MYIGINLSFYIPDKKNVVYIRDTHHKYAVYMWDEKKNVAFVFGTPRCLKGQKKQYGQDQCTAYDSNVSLKPGSK